jgi:hypothetical protein
MVAHANPDRQLIYINPADLHPYWMMIKDGVEAVQSHQDAWIVEDVYHAIRAGISSLYIGFLDGEYVGFLVVTPQQNYDGMQLFIWCCYAKTDHDPIQLFSNDLKEIAEQVQAKRILFGSSRKWERRLSEHGWKPLTTIYELPL